MKTNQYIILRDTSRINLGDPFAGQPIKTFLPSEAPVPTVQVESLTGRDLADLQRDPTTVGIAPSMPVTLIEPKASEEAEACSKPGVAWGVTVTGADKSPYSGKGVTVAVIDTGIDASHPAFEGVEIIQQDFTGEGDGDPNGHGTHCAGTIFGQVINGFRFSMAPGIDRALIGKVLGESGGGSTEQILRGVLWALDQGAHVISMSLGMDFPGLVAALIQQGYPAEVATSLALQDYRANVRLFDKLAELVFARGSILQGSLLIAASGNESNRPEYELFVAPPATADGIISVGALKTVGEPHAALEIASFSNTGPNVCAPGVKIYSTWTGGGYRNLDGTSMATPHVAGIAALWAEKLLQRSGAVNPVQLSARLIGQAKTERLATGFDPIDVGAGLVQAPLD
jgi:subtilisin family serine protease